MIFLLLLALAGMAGCESSKDVTGDDDNGGLSLPDGFEALVVADSLGRARHLAVRDNGDVYVKLRVPRDGGENVALRDEDGDGRADVVELFGEFPGTGKYGTAMRIYNDYLYFSTAGEVYRQKLHRKKLVPAAEAELIMVDDYLNAEHGYEHIAKPIAFDNEGHIYVPFGAPGDVCQVENRKPGSPGQDPCPELEMHGGVWRFDASKLNQKQTDGYRYATGIRSIVGMAWNHLENELYALQHGRDNFFTTWPHLYSEWESAMLPSEEFLLVKEGSDAGWPYYYYDQIKGKKLLNPEYGGDGEMEGDGQKYNQPLIGFPGHFAPNDLHFYQGDQFPERYRNGAFIAFHGSTIRAPYPQAGYFIAFVPFENGRPSGPFEVFADGFAHVDTIINTSDARYRPMGIAEGPDGSLYFSESEIGRIWRIVFKGDRENFGKQQLAKMEEHKSLPHIKTPDPVLDNLDPVRVEAGAALYRLHCSICHMGDGKGDGTRFPPIDGSEWVSGDSQTLIRLVLEGQQGPITVKGQQFIGVMPGFSYLSDEEIAKILTYIRANFDNTGEAIRQDDVRRVRNRINRDQDENI